MKKTVEKTRTVEVLVCDFCERECGTGNTCHICGKWGCYRCTKFTALYHDKPGRCFADQYIHVCQDCDEAGEDVSGISYQESIRITFDNADHEAKRVIGLWREWRNRRAESNAKAIETKPVRTK